MKSLLLGILVAISLWWLFYPYAVSSKVEAQTIPVEVLTPALVPVCTCESGQGTGKPQQYDVRTGGVLHGRQNPSDIGMCQINLSAHGQKAIELGLDVFTEQGNIKYANWLYSKQGLKPWKYSKSCWGR